MRAGRGSKGRALLCWLESGDEQAKIKLHTSDAISVLGFVDHARGIIYRISKLTGPP
jgi:hypothetical protein